MFNTKTYDSTNNNYNTNFDTYIIGNNNIPADGVKYYSNKFGQVMTSFMVDNGDSVLGGNLIVTESTTIHGNCNLKKDVNISGKLLINNIAITSGATGSTGVTGSYWLNRFYWINRSHWVDWSYRINRFYWIDWSRWIDWSHWIDWSFRDIYVINKTNLVLYNILEYYIR